MRISYDFYDEMCAALSELGNGEAKIPSWDMLRKLERQELTLTVGLFSYISENTEAKSDDEKKRLAYINRILLDKVEFFEGDEPEAETGTVTEDAYLAFGEMADDCIGLLQGKMPDTAAILKHIGPYIRYCFLLAYCFFLKAKKNEWQAKTLLKKLMVENYRFQWADKPVELTVTDLAKLKKDFQSPRYGDVDWLPSVDDIRSYIIPNFDKCYDFVIWLTENAPEPQNKEERESLSMLRSLFSKKIRLLDKNGRRFETIWS